MICMRFRARSAQFRTVRRGPPRQLMCLFGSEGMLSKRTSVTAGPSACVTSTLDRQNLALVAALAPWLVIQLRIRWDQPRLMSASGPKCEVPTESENVCCWGQTGPRADITNPTRMTRFRRVNHKTGSKAVLRHQFVRFARKLCLTWLTVAWARKVAVVSR